MSPNPSQPPEAKPEQDYSYSNLTPLHALSTTPPEQLRARILQAIPDLLMLVSKDGTCLQLISGGEISLHLQGKELELMHIRECLPPHLADERLALIQRALKTGEQQSHEYPIEIQGKLFYEEARIVPVNDEAVLVMVRNMTERRQLEATLEAKAQQEHILNEIFIKTSHSMDLQEVLEFTVVEIQLFLETDRVLFYRFEPDWSGTVVAEAVTPPWPALLGHRVMAHCLAPGDSIDAYISGQVHVIPDVYDADLSLCHLELLEHWQVKANLLVPVKNGEELHGLLAAQQCCAPRPWQTGELDLMLKVANHLARAIHQNGLYHKLQIANAELERLATTDGLTQVANRLRFDSFLSREWFRMQREQTPLALILFDIDYFKQYNDLYGHPEGDTCLVWVAATAREMLKRPADFIARYGGEEFAVLMPNTSLDGAYTVAEEIRQAIYDQRIPHQGSGLDEKVVTVSVGVACVIPNFEGSSHQLISKADQALYQAKLSGRNCCCRFSV
jgi:diguanylate cyclase (GGDEF)-like protein/PAS domain S-box-containing protein